MTLLLSLTSGSLRSLLDPKADPPRTLHDVPGFTSNQLGLRGLSLHVDMLSGAAAADLDTLRHRADQAGCPCLVLVDDEPLEIASEDADVRAGVLDRLGRLAAAASRLGCNSLSVRVSLPAGDEAALDRGIELVQQAMVRIERQELNLLLAPGPGLAATSEGLSDLIKRVGGFRIGALPTYGDPHTQEDPIEFIRKMAPYAGAIHLRCEGFKRGGAHRGLDLAAGVQAAKAVGYQSNLVIDYVGEGDPAADIRRAAEVLQAAIDAE
ncbi:MAG: TIM barrel protein [Phycisphaerales bacterium]|jgi:sugar phosphate isomerase/epimerase|nr:TIM barrel protein [Phycisphaerales bacterium]